MLGDHNCPFCAIGSERIAVEWSSGWGIWDGFPVSPGHLLIVPKRHAATWDDLTESEKAGAWAAVDRAILEVRKKYSPDGFNVGFNFGRAGGQTVFHFHLHVLFASIQTLGRSAHLRKFAQDVFDYVIVDEFHHAAAPTYRTLIEHFTPKFMLDRFADAQSFEWQTQTQTTQTSKHGQIIRGTLPESSVHLFVRTEKLRAGKAAPFRYCGPLIFKGWEGEKPISVVSALSAPVPRHLWRSLRIPSTV